MDFAVPADLRIKLKTYEKRDKYLDLARELKKLWNMKVTIMPIVIWNLGSHQRIDTKTGGLGNNGTGGNCPNYSIVEIDQNTEKSPGDLRRLVVTQTSMRNYQLTLVWNLENELSNNNNNNNNNNNMLQTCTKGVQDQYDWVGKVIDWEYS